MSTHIDGLSTINTRVNLSTNDELAGHYPEYFSELEEEGSDRVLALEAPGNCHLVVVEGNLEDFARNVWRAVFGQEPPVPNEG